MALGKENIVEMSRVSDNTPLRLGNRIGFLPEAGISVAFSPDGQILASLSGGGTVRLWRISDGTLLHTLGEEKTGIQGGVVAFSQDGLTLVAQAFKATGVSTWMWRVSDGSLLRAVGEYAYGGVFSRDWQTLASVTDDGTVQLWQVSDGTLLRTLKGNGNRNPHVHFSPDGQTMASVTDDSTVQLWQVSDGTLLRTLKAHVNRNLRVLFSPDGRTLASVTDDGALQLWRVSDGTLLRTIIQVGRTKGVEFSPDGQALVWAMDKTESTTEGTYTAVSTVRLFRVTEGALLHTVEMPGIRVTGVELSSDGNTMAMLADDGSVRLWQLR